MKEERFIRTVCDTSDLSNCFGNKNLRLLDFLLLLSQSFFVPVHVRAAAVTAQTTMNPRSELLLKVHLEPQGTYHQSNANSNKIIKKN